MSSQLLVHFDPKLEICLACDASAYGIGVVLSHKMPDGSEKPVGFASRTLTQTEKNYSQMEKEGLPCVYGVKHFHSHNWVITSSCRPIMSHSGHFSVQENSPSSCIQPDPENPDAYWRVGLTIVTRICDHTGQESSSC